MDQRVAYLEFEKPVVELERRIADLKSVAERDDDLDQEIRSLQERAQKLRREIYEDLSIWQKVLLSRHPDRPFFADYLERLCDGFVELHGDRVFGDDPAIVAGFAHIDGRSVGVIGQQKGRTTKEKLRRNFGMPHPEGYRKAVRVMELASRFGRPILTFIDTQGAYPGMGAEERGQSEAIGQSLLCMSRLRVPVIASVIGEGGSGGALALGVANRVLMLQYATYSVITPEGCASILWRDATHAPEAAKQLKLLASDAQALGIVDAVIPEPVGGAHRDYDEAAERLGTALRGYLAALEGQSAERLIQGRYEKFRAMGIFSGKSGKKAGRQAWCWHGSC
ncbi:MAG: acetyl-CoA carboxylase carboxyltransferase subunit alpha [Proteobacteria bacterium]|nr:acetyl-CoA carboxylase carboxyltransferase subunit alpha [Pseudomonadota bacterium]